MSGPKPVVVVGSVNLDFCVLVDHLPRDGETVMGGTHWRSQGGKGANQAAAAATLGAGVTLVAAVGDDDLGANSIEDLAARGVDTSLITRHHGVTTGVAQIVIDRRGRNQIAVASGANLRLDAAAVEAALERFDDAIVLVSLEVPDDAVRAAIAVADTRGWTSILNPAPFHELAPELLRRVSVVTPNEREAAALLDLREVSPDSLGEASTAVRARSLGISNLLVTLGEQGAALLTTKGSESVAPPPVRAVDTTGAGDVLNGALAAAIASGVDIATAARIAVAAASLSTEHQGARAQLPRLRDVEAVLGQLPRRLFAS